MLYIKERQIICRTPRVNLLKWLAICLGCKTLWSIYWQLFWFFPHLNYFLLLIVFISVIILSQSYKRIASWITVKKANNYNADRAADKSVPCLSVQGDADNKSWNFLKLRLVNHDLTNETLGKTPEFGPGTIGKVSSLLLQDLPRMRTVYLSVPRSLRHASASFRKSFISVSLTAPVVCRLSLTFE